MELRKDQLDDPGKGINNPFDGLLNFCERVDRVIKKLENKRNK